MRIEPPHGHECNRCERRFIHRQGECSNLWSAWCGCLPDNKMLRELAPWLVGFRTTAMMLSKRMIDRRVVY